MFKALFFHLDGVRTYRQWRRAVVAGTVRAHHNFRASILVDDRHFGIGNCGSARIGDDACNFSPVS